MNGEAHWLTLVVVVGFLVVLALLVVRAVRPLSRYNWYSRRQTCPRTGEPVELIVRGDSLSGRSRIEHCSRIEDSQLRDCADLQKGDRCERSDG